MSPQRTYINAVYYPSWRIYKGFAPSCLDLDCIDRVFYAFALLDESGNLRHLDDFADCTKEADGSVGCLRALAGLKQQKPTLKTLISVGGGGKGSNEFPAMAGSAACRARFAASCKQFVEQFQLDGVDIDWEHPVTPQQGADFTALLRALRAALPSPRYLLTAALPTGEYCLRNIDLEAAADILDTVNLMGYDFNGAWTDVSGHHAQLMPLPGPRAQVYPALRNSCHRGVEYVASRGFPRRKIVLGVPAYARWFAGARGIGQPFGGAGEIDYVDLPREWIRGARVDRDAGAASYVDDDDSPDGKGFVSFDVPETVRQKAAYVRGTGLGGLFYWTGVGDLKGHDSLVRAGCEELRRAWC